MYCTHQSREQSRYEFIQNPKFQNWAIAPQTKQWKETFQWIWMKSTRTKIYCESETDKISAANIFSSKRKEILGNESWGHHVGKISHFIKTLAHSVLLDDFEKGLPSGQEWFLRWYWDESHIVDNDHDHNDGIMYDMAILMTMTMLVTMVTIIGMTMIWQLW